MKNDNPIHQLAEIKALMEKSTRFLSLSGLAGVSAGIIALIGATAAFYYLQYDIRYSSPNEYFLSALNRKWEQASIFLFFDAVTVLSEEESI